MKTVRMLIGAIAISAAACGQQPASTGTESTATGTSALAVTLPPGDAKAGRQAFMDLRCTACHAVPSEPEFPPPVSAKPAPPITSRVGSRDASYLVTAIVSPSHEISLNSSDEVLRARLSGVLSPMGDFSRVMTVRQLVDLNAYLRSLE